MKLSFKPILATLLAALTVLPLTACGTHTEAPAETTVGAEETTASEEEILYGDLPTGDFGGYEFNVLQYAESAATSTVLNERTGNPIEDKIYERAIAVEEKLGVKFVNHLDTLSDVVTTLRNCIAGGMDEYDVFWAHSTTTISNFLAPGYLLDLNTIDGLDFEKPWWDDNANDYLALDEHTYMAFGDINIYLYDFHSAILFNKDVTDMSRLNLYNMVKDGTWTMDRFISLATELALPAADGSTAYDRMAYTGYATATMFGFLHGADAKLFTNNDEGIPQMSTANEHYLDVLFKYNSLFKDTALCNPYDGACVATFAAQKAAFISCGVGELGALRQESFDYGLLPFPKYNKAQENYISFVTNQIQPMVIPKSATDANRTGIILENLAAESYRRVRPEYFQVLLESKYVRDHESMENMDMLFTSETRFELELIYDWNNFQDHVVKALTENADSFSSTSRRYSKALNRSIQKTLDYLAQGAAQ